MGSEGEIFRQYKADRKAKKEQNYTKTKAILEEKNINFTEKANGHFIIGYFDFWATTGLFINRKTKKRNRGIFNLLKKL